MTRTLAAALLLLAACDYDPRGRCGSAADCLAGQVCTAGVCAAPGAPPPNQAPTAAADGYAVAPGQLLQIAAPGVLANDVDPDGDPLVADRLSLPGHGAAFLGSDGGLVYQPGVGFTGTDSFTYRASDGALQSAVTTVTITVGP